MCSSEAQRPAAPSRVDEALVWVVATGDLSSDALAGGREMLSGAGGRAHTASSRRFVLTRGTNPPAGATGGIPLDAPGQHVVCVATADRTSRAVTEEGR